MVGMMAHQEVVIMRVRVELFLLAVKLLKLKAVL
jgi:hypothetical protein